MLLKSSPFKESISPYKRGLNKSHSRSPPQEIPAAQSFVSLVSPGSMGKKIKKKTISKIETELKNLMSRTCLKSQKSSLILTPPQ